MFKIEMMVEDKRLAKVLKAVSGEVFDLQVNPVVNAAVKKGKVKEVNSADLGVWLKEAIADGKTVFSTKEIVGWGNNHGLKPPASMKRLETMMHNGVVSRFERGAYKINSDKL